MSIALICPTPPPPISSSAHRPHNILAQATRGRTNARFGGAHFSLFVCPCSYEWQNTHHRHRKRIKTAAFHRCTHPMRTAPGLSLFSCVCVFICGFVYLCFCVHKFFGLSIRLDGWLAACCVVWAATALCQQARARDCESSNCVCACVFAV